MQVTSRDGLASWLDTLARRATVIAPKAAGEQVRYQPVGGSAEIVFDFGKTDLPAKEHFFPATHVLFSVEREDGRVQVKEPVAAGERVVFGLRPCDARALRVLDALLIADEPIDPYYAERREKATLIGLACREMGSECFCTSVGLSPTEASDVDLMLAEVDGGYTVQVVTDKGKVILDGLLLEEAEVTPPDPVGGDQVPILEAEAWPQHFSDAFWARLADRCLSCRLCAYVCPTCRCFDVRDDETPGREIKRLRAWDSCMAESYRRIAGGHNPRPTKADRLRNRFYCKFCYYPRDFGPIACVGCGRCINACPVNVDIAEMLRGVAAL